MPKTKADAEGALYEAISAAARSAAENRDSTLLEKAATAFREVAYGPQGGAYEDTRYQHTTSEAKTATSTVASHYTDDHITRHPDGEARPEVGFGAAPERGFGRERSQ